MSVPKTSRVLGRRGWSVLVAIACAAALYAIFTEPTQAQPGKPTILEPVGPGHSDPPLFKWNEVTGAADYVVWILDTTGATVHIESFLPGVCSQPPCQTTTSATLSDGEYTWVVFARDSGGVAGPASDPLVFNIGFPPVNPVTLIAPVAGGISSNPTYSWSSVPDATGYSLLVVDTSGSNPPAVDESYTDLVTLCPSDCSVTPSGTLPDANYVWAVVPFNNSGNGPAATALFRVGAPLPAPNLLLPQGFVYESPKALPTYEWDPVPGAISYLVLLYTFPSAQLINVGVAIDSAACGTGTCIFSPAGTGWELVSGAYMFFVAGVELVGAGPMSQPLVFSVATSAPLAPSTTAPTGAIDTSNPTYLWDPVWGAESYELKVEDGQGLVFQNQHDATAVCAAAPCTAMGEVLDGGSYTWSVKGTNPLGGDAWSTPLPFTVPSSMVAVGFSHSMVVTWDGEPWAWGANDVGQLGDGTEIQRLVPTELANPSIANLQSVALGADHSVAVTDAGALYAWGSNASGQLGRVGGDTSDPVLIGNGFSQVSVGAQHTLALDSGGLVFAWGSNGFGQVGVSGVEPQDTPIQVPGLPIIQRVIAGANHSLALAADGSIWAWGRNDDGQLGDGTLASRSSPEQVADDTGTSITGFQAIGSGPAANHVLAIQSDDTVWAWGSNDFGQLGDGTQNDAVNPVQVSGLGPAKGVSVGESHSLAVLTDDTVQAWGDNASGQLGDGGVVSDSSVPLAIAGLSDVSHVAAGQLFSAAVTSDGTLYLWGTNDQGQLGDGTTLEKNAPLDISHSAFAFRTATPRIRVATGTYENDLQVTIGFDAAVQGATIYYTTNGNEPTPSDDSIISGASITVDMAITLKAKAFASGFTESHTSREDYTFQVGAVAIVPALGTFPGPQLVSLSSPTAGSEIRYTLDGSPPTASSLLYTEPFWVRESTQVRALGLRTAWLNSDATSADLTIQASSVGAGANHTTALTSSGTVYAWGDNSSGELGDGTWTAHKLPAAVSSLTNIVALATGNYHSVVLEDDGTVHAWGDNSKGQIGDGTVTDRLTPVSVPGLTNIVAVAAGGLHSMALEDDGTVWAWGYNDSGQLGDGTLTQRTSPVGLTSVTDVVSIGAGWDHTFAVKSDGTLWAWGENFFGQLGDGTETDQSSPVQVQGLSGIVAAAGGRYHSLALRDDGQVFAWGAGQSGQIGNGSDLDRLVPVPVSISGAVSISAGQIHSFAVKTDGSQWGWGQSIGGQVGNDTEDEVLTPVQLAGPSNVVGMAGGSLHSVAVTSDGSVWAWGTNVFGQVGDGTTIKRLSPVRLSEPGFDWKTATPTFSIDPGQYAGTQDVIVSTTDPTSTLRFTTTGAEPVETDAVVAPEGVISIAENTTLKVKAFHPTLAASNTTEAAYLIQAETPTATPSEGSYPVAQQVDLDTLTPGAAIHYTTNGDPPTQSSAQYTPGTFIPISTSTTLKAKAFKSNLVDSEEMNEIYQMSFGQLPAPGMSPQTGTFESTVQVTITEPPGSEVRHTTNGSDPTETSALYQAPLDLAVTTTLRARAFHPDHTPSEIAEEVYTIKVPDSVASPAGSTYAAGQAVTITNPLADAVIHYTLDGTNPTEGDPTIDSVGKIVLLANLDLKLRAFKTGVEPSDVVLESYVVTGSIDPLEIAAGSFHSAAIQDDGSGWVWGSDSGGQLGNGAGITSESSPQAITELSNVLDIDGGSIHSLAVKSDQTAVASGNNGSGRLGDNTQINRDSFVPVNILTGLTSVAAGGSHSLGLQSDGTLWAWGHNSQGQLGDNSTTARHEPVAVHVITNVEVMDAGEQFSVALISDGSVWAWGDNSWGQLGDGSNSDSLVPVLADITNVIAMAAGSDHVLAVKDDQTLWAWGRNQQKQLGDGTTTSRNNPGQVRSEFGAQSTGLTKVINVGAGQRHSFAVRADGGLWAWGENVLHQLGDGLTANGDHAQPVDGLTGIVAATGGNGHSLAVSAAGELWGWGQNTNGQVGDGTELARPTPVSVSAADLEWRVAAPVMSPPGGTHDTELGVNITSATDGAQIYYTTTGADPTTNDLLVPPSGDVSVTDATTLKARAFKSGLADSVVTEEAYTFSAATPTFDPVGNIYTENQTVTISSTSEGVTIRYTDDGSIPTETSTEYSGPLSIAAYVHLRAVAFRDGWSTSGLGNATYTMNVAPAVILPAGGSFDGSVSVTVTGDTPGSTLHYTTDGTEPSESSPSVAHGGAVTLTQTGTLLVKAFNGIGWNPSDVTVGTFHISQGTLAAPTVEPAGDSYDDPQLVSLYSSIPNVTIRYTLDGTEPDFDSQAFSAPILVDWSATLKAKAFATDWLASPTAEETYTINLNNTVEPVSFSLEAGRYSTVQTVTLTSATAGVAIHYTLDGRDPDPLSDPSVSSGGSVPIDHGLSLKAVAVLAGMIDSPVRRADYLITGAVASAYRHALALKTDGTVLSWGLNDFDQLGRTTSGTGAQLPALVPGLSDVVAISVNGLANGAASFALKSDGTLWGWGENGNGELGNGTTDDQPSPTPVSGSHTFVAVSAGKDHTLAIDDNGNVWAWGWRDSGALGDGLVSGDVTEPQAVSGLPNIIAVSAGRQFSLALAKDGSLYSWGDNFSGQLGNGTTTDGLTPQLVPNLSGISEISAGRAHALALQPEGTINGAVWAWGENDKNQLGDGPSMVDRLTPIRVATQSRTLSAFDNQSLLVEEDSGFQRTVLGAGSHFADRVDAEEDGVPTSSDYFMTILRGDVVEVSAGTSIMLALLADTTVREWGTLFFPSGPADGNLLGDNTGAVEDDDGDGLTNGEEWALGTDPYDSDTNDDGILDGIAQASGMSATDSDMDDDGVLNGAERAQGTDPFNADTDDDGTIDGLDAFPLDPTRTAAPDPVPGDTDPPVITLEEPTNATLVSSDPP